jgi:cardiolipin synthase
MTWSDVYYASEWAVRLVMLVYVPQRRTPAAARTWLLLIFLLPWPGLLLYGVFGRAFLPARRRELQSRVLQFLRHEAKDFFRPYQPLVPLDERSAEASRLAEKLGEFPAVRGNRFELLPDYDRSLDRLVADIDGAGHHVHLLYYIFADDVVGRRVEEALSRATARGVECRLLVDAQGSRAFRRTAADRLRAAGIEVCELLRTGVWRRAHARFDLRNHRKIAVIDGRIGYVGSQNIVRSTFKPGLEFEELVTRAEGPIVAQLQAILLADRFVETGQRPNELPPYFPKFDTDGGVAAQALPSGPGYPRQNTLQVVTSLVYDARKSVVITTPYFIPDETLLRALVSAALRGVDVRLIVSRDIDQFLVGFAQRSYYDELLSAGVAVHHYRTRFLHAKHLSIDDAVVVIGSSNMDIRSFALNAEAGVLVYDTALAVELKRVQTRQLAESDRLTLEVWRSRPRTRQVAENVARLFDSLL